MYDVIIVGAGPGGIAAAIECKKAGISNILVLEKTDKISAMIREYYKAGKRVDKDYKGQVVELAGNIPFGDSNKEDTLALFERLLAENSVEILYNHEVDRIVKKGEIFSVRCVNNEVFECKFAIIGIGKMGKPNKPSYPLPISLRKKVNFNVNDCVAGEKILVVGGGNSAVEYAVYLTTITPTTLNYRRKEFSRINEENARELESALSKGLKGKFGIDIESVSDVDSKLCVTFSDGSSESFDRIVYAIGGVTPVDFLRKCGVEIDSNGAAKADENRESEVKNLFVVGDLLYKNGGSIAISMNDAHKIVGVIKSRLG
ncbi:FAD-binding protein [Helicobacter saguini]|uniref:FAD-binding protein n=1 Tax=Helicobacter saguini TaxID=1548018 RepID=A0A347W4C8_9HELI|nr:NAD(P)-binding domain-containing protein [Helicobacter saguini]MWV61895.1 FAD-binding protein [Helicobacter saguini]MWV67430.1 FAD-binding protein [Helicobacter saguini]MWV69783.1 FAD-binding protein [Helicobacter saguini]MWV73000.1 FAD-binding protein [Helicobacter saguini]TLD95620.1 FAD-dependent oxidoreductase [Helicobacter saguini]